mmetsp:Transcript_94887/g.306303  ORF Transcript_94887/g.306303 Transcript_94887/m.306303 type:complete len:185 (-) Transcript_94887:144-698(-)
MGVCPSQVPPKLSEEIVENCRPPTKRKVRLAATPFGPPLPQCQAYHTSIVVGEMEFAFSSKGIEARRGIQSHIPFPGNPTVTNIGFTNVPRSVMVKVLRPFFLPGSYDLLRKNCNSFSDCALFLLLGVRLDEKYRTLEKIGEMADKYTGIVSNLTGGKYKPNPKADAFQSSQVLAQLPEPCMVR